MNHNVEKENMASGPARRVHVAVVKDLVKTYGGKGVQTRVLKGIDLEPSWGRRARGRLPF